MNNAGQHGRQPTPQAAPPADPRLRNVPANPTGPTTTPTTITESSGICRDYIWGICTMGDQCIYRHDLEFEAMKETLKFCHDHQNRTGCIRPDCTYLHTTRDEENLFLTVGQIPRVLVDRYAKMSYQLRAQTRAEADSAPQIFEYPAQPQPPPPPPPPPAQVGPMVHSPRPTQQQQLQTTIMVSPVQGAMNGAIQGPMPCSVPSPIQGPMQGPMLSPIQGPMQGPMPSPIQGPMQGPMPCPMPGPMQGTVQGPMPCPMPCPGPMQGPIPIPIQGHMQGPMPGPIQGPMQSPMRPPMQGPMTGSAAMPQMPAPMQPPPPPPPPPTSSISSSRMSGPVYTGSHPASSKLVSTHNQPATSSLPAMFDPTKPPPPFQKPTLKRSAEDCEAGPCKLRKSETSNESSCEKCMQRLIRIEFYTRQMEEFKQEKERNEAEDAARVKEFEQKKKIIQAVLSPHMYRIAEEYIESGTPAPSASAITAALSEVFPNSFSSQFNSITPSTSTSSLLNMLLTVLVGREREAEPAPVSSDASLIQQLTTRLRPTSVNNGSSDLLSTLLDVMRNSPTDRNPSESRNSVGSVGSTVHSFSDTGPSTVRPYEGGGPSSSRPYEGVGPSSSRPYGNAGPPPSRPYESTGPSPSRFHENAGPSPSRFHENAGPSPSRPYDTTGPLPSRPYDATGPLPPRPYDAAGPLPSRPYDGPVASMTYTDMSLHEPVRYPPPTSTAPANGQYHSGMEFSVMALGPRPVPAPAVQFPGPGPYGSPQPQVQAQGLPSRPPFYVQMPPYNGGNPPYPGMMPQAGRPPMQPPQNPPNNFFFGTRYPNYYPPYQ